MSKSLGFSNADDRKINNIQLNKINALTNVQGMFDCGASTHANMNLQYDITIPNPKKNTREEDKLDKIWKFSSFTLFTITSIFLLMYSLMEYKAKKDFIVPSLVGVAIAISLMTWFRNMLSMNMFSDRNIVRRFALILYLLAGICFLASSIAVMQQNSFLQFIASFAGAIIGWKGFVVIYEGEYKRPTYQQLAALLQILLISGLWEFRTYLVNLHFQ